MFLMISLLHSQYLRSSPDYFINGKYAMYSTLNAKASGETGTEEDRLKEYMLLLLIFKH